MPSQKEIEDILRRVKDKIVLDDYDLGVLATLKWLAGEPEPYRGRVE